MKTATNGTKRKRSVKRTLLWITAVFFIIITIAFVFVYNNFNRLLTAALTKSFNSNIISNVYELKFEKLSVNFLAGNVNVYNVKLQPRENPLHDYPYINSSFRLSTKKIALKNVKLLTLIKQSELKVEEIQIIEPDFQLVLDGDNYVLLPFKDTTGVAGTPTGNKKAIQSFSLKEFNLQDASFSVTNKAKQRNFGIKKLNIVLSDLMIDQQQGRDIVSYEHVDLSIAEFTGNLQQKALKYINFKDFKIAIDTLQMQQSPDTTIFHFADFSTGLKKLNIQTRDNIFHLTMESFNLSEKEKSIKLTNISFKPNISNEELQKKSIYQKEIISATVGTLNLSSVNFDSLIYSRKIFISKIFVDKASVVIFKDKRKPMDKNRFPKYLAQKIKAIPIPLSIKHLKATNVNLVSTELIPVGRNGKANINRATLEAKNITNLPSNETLTLTADAYIENTAHVHLNLGYSYLAPQVSINGNIQKCDLTGLNKLIQSYTPASIKKGIIDEMSFSGTASGTHSDGTMKFLYHDLEVDLALTDKAKWKSAVLTFGANAYLKSSNPPSENIPARIVQYHVERDMNKGFVNLLVKSVLAGVKETLIMSKENRKEYKEIKKAAKKEEKQAKKEARKEKKAAKKEQKEAKKEQKKKTNK